MTCLALTGAATLFFWRLLHFRLWQEHVAKKTNYGIAVGYSWYIYACAVLIMLLLPTYKLVLDVWYSTKYVIQMPTPMTSPNKLPSSHHHTSPRGPLYYERASSHSA